ncbi:uncharacterized protein LOC135829142 [Sycon ciliatum]|uniref:uncharacterized protein LOC135829142 n=1 Tax=Sycon ciliatum TaxID=27933 RepID=UPI0031F7002C
MSRSRVAPTTATSIPRLEFLAAVAGVDLVKPIIKALSHSTSVVFWTDSQDVLHWIRGASRKLKTFVGNRVAYIQESTHPSQWRYVPTAENPADHLTRGHSAKFLAQNSQWWEAPSFLQLMESEWPATVLPGKSSTAVDQETRKSTKFDSAAIRCVKKQTDTETAKSAANAQAQSVVLATQKSAENNSSGWQLDPSRFSKWLVLVRQAAWVIRFANNCRTPAAVRVMTGLTTDTGK